MIHTLISPTGDAYQVANLREFCRRHGLDNANINHVVWGSRRHHKGWTCPESGYVRTYAPRRRSNG